MINNILSADSGFVRFESALCVKRFVAHITLVPVDRWEMFGLDVQLCSVFVPAPLSANGADVINAVP